MELGSWDNRVAVLCYDFGSEWISDGAISPATVFLGNDEFPERFFSAAERGGGE